MIKLTRQISSRFIGWVFIIHWVMSMTKLSAPALLKRGSYLVVVLLLVGCNTPGGSSSASAVASGVVGSPSNAVEERAPDFIWPSASEVIKGFDEVGHPALDIAGVAGAPVLAAADGQVVYAGDALKGYGKLVILKHDGVYMTAYGHNQKLSVEEGDVVRRGQEIGQMGSTEADRVKLRFEVRHLGKPVDPLRFLPKR